MALTMNTEAGSPLLDEAGFPLLDEEAVFASYDAANYRVVLDMTVVRAALGHFSNGLIERSTDQITWTTVRGCLAARISSNPPPAIYYDYEFVSDVENFYRVTADTATYADVLLPALSQPVLKSPLYPSLNVAIKLADLDDLTRPANGSVFSIMGQSAPVTIPQLRGGRQTAITVETDSDAATAALVALLAPGDIVFVHVPGGYTVPRLGGYYYAGDTTETRQDVPWAMRWTTIPLTEVAPPDAAVTGIDGVTADVIVS